MSLNTTKGELFHDFWLELAESSCLSYSLVMLMKVHF